MQQTAPWILASIAIALFLGAWVLSVYATRRNAKPTLPTEWGLSARPVFSADERRAYRQLREALPHQVVLSKLPLVRFCQPNDPQEVRYWYDLLGSTHVSFAVCSANGRVLAAIDLVGDRGSSRRALQIKQSVLGACRVRYLRCSPDQMPSVPELQLLVPHSGGAVRGAQPGARMRAASETLQAAVSRGRERRTLWQDSGSLHDSFFGVDDGRDEFGVSSLFGSLRGEFAPGDAPVRPRSGAHATPPQSATGSARKSLRH